MSNQSGYLTILSIDRKEIYGEFADGEWTSEMTDAGTNNIFTGTPSEGTLETFLQLDADAISHVAYTFEPEGQKYSGTAELLAPSGGEFGNPLICIETGEMPISVSA